MLSQEDIKGLIESNLNSLRRLLSSVDEPSYQASSHLVNSISSLLSIRLNGSPSRIVHESHVRGQKIVASNTPPDFTASHCVDSIVSTLGNRADEGAAQLTSLSLTEEEAKEIENRLSSRGTPKKVVKPIYRDPQTICHICMGPYGGSGSFHAIATDCELPPGLQMPAGMAIRRVCCEDNPVIC